MYAPRAVRLQWVSPTGTPAVFAPALVTVGVDGAAIARRLDVPTWGLCVGVPGGLLLVDVGAPAATAAQWQVTASPGAPVIEHVTVTAPQVASVQTPPTFARAVTVGVQGAGAVAVTLASGVVVAVAPGASLSVPAQVLGIAAGPASDVSLDWEVYQ